MKKIFFPQLDSTNDFLKRYVNERLKSDALTEVVCCYTFKQDSGRGRNGRKFISNDGGLYMSFLEPKKSSKPNYTLQISLKVLEILENFFKIDLKIKWVNDIILGQKKCAGILVESVRDYYVIGIGINIFNQLPADLLNMADTFAADADRLMSLYSLGKSDILNQLADLFCQKWEEPTASDWLVKYKSKSSVLNAYCTLSDLQGNVVAKGVVVDFEEDGSVVMESDGIRKSYNSGELLYSLRGENCV